MFSRIFTILVVVLATSTTTFATTIVELLVPPSTPGNAYSGTFFVTPSAPLWAFGVGNPNIQDTAISGISSIDGLEANDHWISSLISRNSWDNGYNFDGIRPIGASPPSSFSMDTSSMPWLWGSSDYVAFYWLSEAGPANNLAILQTGTTYDAFRFFTSGPASPFAAFTAPDGGTFQTGETIVQGAPGPGPGVPEPVTLSLIGVGLFGISLSRRRRS